MRKLVSTREGAVKDIYRTAPYMKVMKLGTGPGLPAKELKGTATSVRLWNPVEDMD